MPFLDSWNFAFYDISRLMGWELGNIRWLGGGMSN